MSIFQQLGSEKMIPRWRWGWRRLLMWQWDVNDSEDGGCLMSQQAEKAGKLFMRFGRWASKDDVPKLNIQRGGRDEDQNWAEEEEEPKWLARMISRSGRKAITTLSAGPNWNQAVSDSILPGKLVRLCFSPPMLSLNKCLLKLFLGLLLRLLGLSAFLVLCFFFSLFLFLFFFSWLSQTSGNAKHDLLWAERVCFSSFLFLSLFSLYLVMFSLLLLHPLALPLKWY